MPMASFCFGVIPPSAILGRSLLYVQSQAVAACGLENILVEPVISNRAVKALHISILLRIARLDELQYNAVLFSSCCQQVTGMLGELGLLQSLKWLVLALLLDRRAGQGFRVDLSQTRPTELTQPADL